MPPEHELDPALVGRLLPWLRALRGYTRLKVEGLENVPRGPAVLAANHTGWLGLDYALTALSLHDGAERLPRGLAHPAWFRNPGTARFAQRVGLVEVSKDAMADLLSAGHLVMVFPEGEKGAFRAASGYRVGEFARGFVRVALARGVPIVPVAVLGGEESNPVERTIDSYESLLRMPIPVPTNLWPKAVKWRIAFLPAVDLRGAPAGAVDDRAFVHAQADAVRASVQAALDRLITERGDPYK